MSAPERDPAKDEDTAVPLDDGRYASLAAASAEGRSRRIAGEPDLGTAAAAFLYWEARLLDARLYRDWLKLLAPDMVYWVPADPSGGDPRAESSINFDDRRRLIDRITLIETGALHAQMPPSRTCRLVGNIEAWRGADGAVNVRSNLVLWEHRRGRTISFAGWQEHELIEGTSHRLIRRKVVNLLDCDQPQGSVSFIL
jgi:3-phenylpropionate/cinnamic acid dioxygenase small subunit